MQCWAAVLVEYTELNQFHMEQDLTFMPNKLQAEEQILQAKFETTYLCVQKNEYFLLSQFSQVFAAAAATTTTTTAAAATI